MKDSKHQNTYRPPLCHLIARNLVSIEGLENEREVLQKSRSLSLVLGGYLDFGRLYLGSEGRVVYGYCVDIQDTLVCTKLMYHHNEIEQYS